MVSSSRWKTDLALNKLGVGTTLAVFVAILAYWVFPVGGAGDVCLELPGVVYLELVPMEEPLEWSKVDPRLEGAGVF